MPHELVDRRNAEGRIDLGVELLPQRALDTRAQVAERVELARGARQIVVERRQHLLLYLAHRDLDRRRRPVGESKDTCFVSPAEAPSRAVSSSPAMRPAPSSTTVSR